MVPDGGGTRLCAPRRAATDRLHGRSREAGDARPNGSVARVAVLGSGADVGAGAARTTDLWALLEATARTRGHRPLLTAVDAATGARTELSALTFLGWAAKTGNLLVEELGVEPGAVVAGALHPASWPALVWACACWGAGTTWAPVATSRGPGGTLTLDGAVPSAAVVVADEAVADAARRAGAALVAVGAGFGARLTTTVAGWLPWAEEVLGFGDDLTVVRASADADAVLLADGTVRTQHDIVRAGRADWSRAGWTPSDRILWSGGRGEQVLPAFVAVLHAGASMIVLAGADERAREDAVAQERATRVLGGD